MLTVNSNFPVIKISVFVCIIAKCHITHDSSPRKTDFSEQICWQLPTPQGNRQPWWWAVDERVCGWLRHLAFPPLSSLSMLKPFPFAVQLFFPEPIERQIKFNISLTIPELFRWNIMLGDNIEKYNSNVWLFWGNFNGLDTSGLFIWRK